MPPESTGQQDVRAYLRILWRWKLLFVAFVVLIPLGAYLVERGKPKVYQSSTLVAARASALDTGSASAPLVNNSLLAVARLITTTPVADTAAILLHPPPASPGSLVGQVTVAPDINTGFITITAQDHDPLRAAAIANAFAAALGSHQTVQANHDLDQQIGALQRQLSATPGRDPAAQTPLLQQLAQLKAARGATGAGAVIIERAVPSFTPVGPKTRRAVELALVIALLLGFGAVLAAENGDRRLRTPEDLEALTGWPLLGAIPRGAFSSDPLATPADDEAFQMLRGSLTYFNVDRPLASVAVISPLIGDGKTTVAVGLAVAAARAGKRTILVDADLRRPQVCTRLGLEPSVGLGAVLAHERQLAEVLIEHVVDTPEGGRLLVLPAGPPPPNPSALLSSQGMRTVMRELESQADLVVVDTAAALAVSDSLPLVQTTSGVVMIVRMNRSSRAAVKRLQKVILSSHGTVMGVVATGSDGLGRAYGDYARSQKKSRREKRRMRKRRRKAAAMPASTLSSATPATVMQAPPPPSPPEAASDGADVAAALRSFEAAPSAGVVGPAHPPETYLPPNPAEIPPAPNPAETAPVGGVIRWRPFRGQ